MKKSYHSIVVPTIVAQTFFRPDLAPAVAFELAASPPTATAAAEADGAPSHQPAAATKDS